MSLCAWVPFPAPGGPSRIRFSSDTGRGAYPSRSGLARSALFQEALVVAHHQLRFELFHRVERDADDDQDRGAAEEEVGTRLVDEDRRQSCDRGEEERPGEREPGEDAIKELGRWPAGSHPRDEASVLLEVVRLVDR